MQVITSAQRKFLVEHFSVYIRDKRWDLGKGDDVALNIRQGTKGIRRESASERKSKIYDMKIQN